MERGPADCPRLRLGVLAFVVFAGILWRSAHPPHDPDRPVDAADAERAAVDLALRRTERESRAGVEAPLTEPAPALWRSIDEAAVNALPEYAAHWSKEGRALVSVKGAVEASRTWRVGDAVAIPLPQLGATYRPVISGIDEGPGGSRAAVARMTDSRGRPLRSVVTAGPGNVFAWIETPEGSYELLADAEFGWLLPTSSMTANMDFGEPDYLLPGADIAEREPAFGPAGADEGTPP